MPNIVEIIIDGKNQGAIKAINGVSQGLLRTERATLTVSDRIKNAFSSGAITLAASGIVASFAYMIKQQVDYADNLSKTAQRIGTTTEQLSTLKYVADLSDVSFENFSTAMQRLSKNIFDVNNGIGQTAKYGFSALSISVNDANGKLKDSSKILLDIADKFSKMEDGTKKTAIAITLFGRSGVQMIPMLNEGRKGIEALENEAKRLGLELSTEAGKRAEEFNDNMTRLKSSFQGLALTLTSDLLPTLTVMSNQIIDTSTKSQGLLNIADMLGISIKSLATFFGGIAAGAIIAGEALGTYYAIMAKILTLKFGDIPFVWQKGWGQIKSTSLDIGKVFDSIWGKSNSNMEKYNNMLEMMKVQQSQLVQDKAIQQLQKNWDKLANTLSDRVITTGMGPLVLAQHKLNLEFERYHKKFDSLPGKFNQLNYYYQMILEKQLDLTAFTQRMRPIEDIILKPIKPPRMMPIDLTPLELQHQRQLAMISEVTIADQLNYMMRQGFAQEAFGNMAQMADTFFQMSGQKSQEMFVLNKAFSIGQAVINTWQGATKALAQGGIIGPIMAATIIASGMAMVAKIAAVQPSLSASFGSGTAGITNVAGIPSTANINTMPRKTTNIYYNGQQQSNSGNSNNKVTHNSIKIDSINISNPPLQGVALDKWVRNELSTSIKKAIKDKAIEI